MGPAGAAPADEFRFAVEEGQLLTAAVADVESRAHRDEVMADMGLMRYGGFETFVSA